MTDVAEVPELDWAARRTAAALRLVDPADALALSRVADAPAGYVLAHDAGDVARHCSLLSPLPGPGEVRAVTTPGRAKGQWHLDVAGRDRPGLLAALTGVLAAQEVDVAQAVIATWADGAALEAFVVRSAAPPDVARLQPAFEASLERPLWSPPVRDALVEFDDAASAVYTACRVRAADRPGLLHAIAVAFAAAGADVHAARVTTAAGTAVDYFDLSDGAGGKLGPGMQEAVRAYVRGGVAAPRRRWSRRRPAP